MKRSILTICALYIIAGLAFTATAQKAKKGDVPNNAYVVTNEVDAIALNTIATNRVTQLWDTTGTQFVDATGTVWRISTIVQTNYGVSTLSALNSYGNFPPQTWYDMPSFDDGWTTELYQDNAYLWYDKGGMNQCAWVAHNDLADGEAGLLEMRLSLELSQQNLPNPPEGIAYFSKTFTYYQVTNAVNNPNNFTTIENVRIMTHTNQTWGAAGTNATYQMSWDVTNGTFKVEEILP